MILLSHVASTELTQWYSAGLKNPRWLPSYSRHLGVMAGSLRSAGTFSQSMSMWPIQHGYLKVVRLLTWGSGLSERESSKRQEVEAASLFRPEPGLAQNHFCHIL